MNQYEIEFPSENPEDIVSVIDQYYRDQTPYNSEYGDRSFGSVYTSYGIKAIDSQYCSLIMNINLEVKQLYSLVRERRYVIDEKTGEKISQFEHYDPFDFDYKGYRGCGVKVEWVDGTSRMFFYYIPPKFDPLTKKMNPDYLRSEIIDNPHLHVKIKENLLLNLDNILKSGF